MNNNIQAANRAPFQPHQVQAQAYPSRNTIPRPIFTTTVKNEPTSPQLVAPGAPRRTRKIARIESPLSQAMNNNNVPKIRECIQQARPQHQEFMRLVQEFYECGILALDSYPNLLHATDSEGNTPLHIAVKMNNLAFTCLLLERGAKVYKKNGDNISPIELARSSSNEKIRELFIDYEVPNALLHKKHTLIEKLITRDVSLSPEDYTAIWLQAPEIALRHTALAPYCPDVILHEAVELQNVELAQKLLDTFPQLVFAQNKSGQTPRTIATANGSIAIVKMLQQREFESIITNINEFDEQACELLQLGCNPFVANLSAIFTCPDSLCTKLLSKPLPECMKELMLDQEKLLTKCRKDPKFVESGCSKHTTPLAAALLLNNIELAHTIMRKLPLTLQLEGIEVLCKSFPNSIATIVKFFFVQDMRYKDMADTIGIAQKLESHDALDDAGETFTYLRKLVNDEPICTSFSTWAEKHLKEFVPERAEYKAKKANLQAKEEEVIKALLKDAPIPEIPTSSSDLTLKWQETMANWMYEESSIRPYPLILALIKLGILKFNMGTFVLSAQ